MTELHIVDYKSITTKAGKTLKMLAVTYRDNTGFNKAATYFVPEDYAGPDPKPNTVMHGDIYSGYNKEGKFVEFLRKLDK